MLVLELRQKGVCSLPALAQQWCRDPAYLKSAVEMWIKLGSRQAFEKVWLGAVKSAVAALGAAAAAAATAKAAAAAAPAGVTAAATAATASAAATTSAGDDAAVASGGGGGGEGKPGTDPGPTDTQTAKKGAESGTPRKKKRKITAATAAAAATAAGGATAAAASTAATTSAGVDAAVASGGGGEGKPGTDPGPTDTQTAKKGAESGTPRKKKGKKKKN